MDLHPHSDCLHVLLDLVCYEMRTHGLSPEMEQILQDHLWECPACREGVRDFEEVLQNETAYQNFG